MVSSVLAQAILDQKQPDIVGSFKEGYREAQAQEVKRLAGLALQEGGGQALDELAGLDPEIAMALGEQLRARSAQDINDFLRDSKIALAKLNAGDVAGTLDFAKQRRGILSMQNRDTTQTDQVIQNLESGNVDQVRQELMALHGAVDQAKGVVVGGRIVDPRTGQVIYEGEDRSEAAQVQSSKILSDGTTVQVMKDGSTRVTDPQGNLLSGESRADAVRAASEYGVQISGEGAAARAGQAQIAKDRQELRKTVFGAARQGQRTLKEVDRLRKALEAVKTGRIAAARQAAGGLIPGARDASAEALNSAINEFVLRRKDELLGGGVLSDADIALLQGVGPQLGNTVDANLEILRRFESVAKNDVDRGVRLKRFKGDPLEFDLEVFEEQASQPQQSAPLTDKVPAIKAIRIRGQ